MCQQTGRLECWHLCLKVQNYWKLLPSFLFVICNLSRGWYFFFFFIFRTFLCLPPSPTTFIFFWDLPFLNSTGQEHNRLNPVQRAWLNSLRCNLMGAGKIIRMNQSGRQTLERVFSLHSWASEKPLVSLRWTWFLMSVSIKCTMRVFLFTQPLADASLTASLRTKPFTY